MVNLWTSLEIDRTVENFIKTNLTIDGKIWKLTENVGHYILYDKQAADIITLLMGGEGLSTISTTSSGLPGLEIHGKI